jgi:hypothetical protein
MLKVFIRARHYDTTMNSARYAQARHLEIEKREMILEVLIPCRLDRRIGSGSSELGLVDEEGKHWWGLSAGTNDDKMINSRRYEQAWFGRGERI